MTSLGMGTYAWFSAEPAEIQVDSDDTATITCAAPELSSLYYFKGNGNPGSANYTGYSKSDATVGNKTNMVDTSAGKFTLDGSSYSSSLLDVPADSNACWGKVSTGDTTTTTEGSPSLINCFNFTKMRPGCYYSFCMVTPYDTSSLTLTYNWSAHDGDSESPKLRLHTGSATTENPINIMMAVNGYCGVGAASGAANYIKETLGVGTGYSLSGTDKVAYSPATAATVSGSYTFLTSSSNNTSSNKYIYFTVYMEADMTHALVYKSTASNIRYYAFGAGGSYAPYEGLTSNLTTIALA